MNRKTLILCGAGAVVVALAASSTASAFVTLQPRRVWDVLPVAIDIDKSQVEASIADGDNGEIAILDALNDGVNGWNGSGAGQIVFGYTTNSPAVQGDGFPTITANDPPNICTGGCLAATLTGFFHATSGDDTIDDADIFIDAQASFTSEREDRTRNRCSANEFYIEGVLQHEVGHVIGLTHTNVAGATMGAFANPCDIGQDELAADDKNGANNLY